MLHVWMPEAHGTWQWSIGDGWFEAKSVEELIQAIQPYHGADVVVFFPSREIQTIQHTMSKAQMTKLGTEGIKYLLEEFVILPIDAMRVVHYFKQPDQLFVMGVAQQTIETMQHSFALLPVNVIALLPDFLILPVPEPNQTIIASIAGRLLIRESDYMGNSCDDLSVYLDFQQPERQYKVANLTPEQKQALSALATHDHIQTFDYQFEPFKKVKQHAWNVLPKVKHETTISGYWKACAAVMVGIIVVQFSYDALRWIKLKHVADQTSELAIQQYKDWFGANIRVTEQNIRGQFESQLRAGQTADLSAIRLLSQIGPVLMQHQMIADQVNYEELTLNLKLKAKDAESLKTLSQQLNQQGLKVQLGNIQPDTLGVIGWVKIQ